MATALVVCPGVHAQEPVVRTAVTREESTTPAPRERSSHQQATAASRSPSLVRMWVFGAIPGATLWWPLVVDAPSERAPMSPRLLRVLVLHGVVPWLLALPLPPLAFCTGQLLGAPAGCLAVGTVAQVVGGIVGASAGGALLPGAGVPLGGIAGSILGRGAGSVVGAALGAACIGAAMVAPLAVFVLGWQKAVGPLLALEAWRPEEPANPPSRPAATAPVTALEP